MPTIYCAALNFEDAYDALAPQMHAAPYNAPPRAPVLYIKPALCRTGEGAAIPCPANTPALRMGGTLAVTIGRRAHRVSEGHALQHVASYAVANDVSIPHNSLFRPAVREQCRDGFCPIGTPTPAEDISPLSLKIRIFVNDVLACETSTSSFRRGVARLIAEISDFITLDPEDVLLMGVPACAPFARPGDICRIEIDQLGSLTNRVTHEEAA